MDLAIIIANIAQQVTEDPAVTGAYLTAIGSALAAGIGGLNLNGRLKEARERGDKLEAELEAEQRLRIDCMIQVAKLQGKVSSMETALKMRGLL